MSFKGIKNFVQAILTKWGKDRVGTLASSLAFYSILSLAPILIIAVGVAGFFFDDAQAQRELVEQAGELMGEQGAEIVQTVLQNTEPNTGLWASIIGFAFLLFGASNIFVQLQIALNRVWDVDVDPDSGIGGTILARASAFLLVFFLGGLLLASLVLSSFLTTMGEDGGSFIWQVLNWVISIAVLTGVFGVVFRYVPDANIYWHDVWIGAFVTALLFTIGRELMGRYLTGMAGASAYGAAGSLMVLLLWLFYSYQIFFFGAEFTQVYSKVRGEAITPARNAVPIRQVIQKKNETIEEHVQTARAEFNQ